jgi:hypothetical protein
MKHDDDLPSCNDSNDVIEDAIDFAKRDPKRTWDDLGRKASLPRKEGDDKSREDKGGKVAAKIRSYKGYAGNMIAGF